MERSLENEQADRFDVVTDSLLWVVCTDAIASKLTPTLVDGDHKQCVHSRSNVGARLLAMTIQLTPKPATAEN